MPQVLTDAGASYISQAEVELTMFVSEDVWGGDAQFAVTVDGVQVGGVYTATASHAGAAAGSDGLPTGEKAIDLGYFSGLQHQLGVTFLNDAYGGPEQDRNLYVDGIALGGQPQQVQNQLLFGYGPGTPQTTTYDVFGGSFSSFAGLVLDVSEDAWQGDAQYQLFLDGNPFGGIRTATQPHATDPAAENENQIVIGPLENGQHTVSIQFINDAYGGLSSTDRNLYLDRASFNGTAILGAAQTLFTDSMFSFALQAETPPSLMVPLITLATSGVGGGSMPAWTDTGSAPPIYGQT